MLFFEEFKQKLQALNGIQEIKVSGTYNEIEVNATEIRFHRGSRKEIRKGSKVIKRTSKEHVKLDDLFRVYQNLLHNEIASVKPFLKDFGSHAAPAVAFLKESGLYDKQGKRIE